MVEEIKLCTEQATELAEELKEKLMRGQVPSSDKNQINLMIAGLGDERGLIRRTFIESLGVVGQSAVPALCHALINHSNVRVRRSAAKALKLTGDPKSLPDLLKALTSDPDTVVQFSSAGAMAIFGATSVKLLINVLINPLSTSMQSGLARWGIAFIGAKAPEAIKEAAQSSNAVVREAAIAALGEQIHYLKDSAAKQLLIKALEDPSPNVRSEATKSIGQLNEPNWTQEILLRMLNDSNSQVRINSALSLMKNDSDSSISELIKRKCIEKEQKVLEILNLAITQLSKPNIETKDK